MNTKTLLETLKLILEMTLPYIQNLIKSKVIPALKRKAYESLDSKADKLITDLAQNASKISCEENELKRQAYIEGTKLGMETLRALAEKLNKAADEIEKAIKNE